MGAAVMSAAPAAVGGAGLTLKLKPNRARPFTLEIERPASGEYIDVWSYIIWRNALHTIVRISSRAQRYSIRHWVGRLRGHELVIEHGPMSIDSTRIDITEQDAQVIAEKFGIPIDVRQ